MKNLKCPVCNVKMLQSANDKENDIISYVCVSNESDLCRNNWHNGNYILIGGNLEKGWNHQNFRKILTKKVNYGKNNPIAYQRVITNNKSFYSCFFSSVRIFNIQTVFRNELF